MSARLDALLAEVAAEQAAEAATAAGQMDRFGALWIEPHVPPRLVDVVRLVTDPPYFELHFEGDAVATIGHKAYSSAAAIGREIEWAVGFAVVLRRGAFPDLRDAILKAARLVEVDPEATDAGLGRAAVQEFIDTKGVTEEFKEAYDFGLPYVEDGHLHIHGPTLRHWVNRMHDDRIDHKRMGTLLRAAGWGDSPIRIDRTVDGKRVSLRLWREAVPLAERGQA